MIFSTVCCQGIFFQYL